MVSTPVPVPVPPPSAHLVRQHNALTTARYSYSELQMDFLLFLLSKLRPTADDLVYDLHLADLTKLTGKRYNYKYLQVATEEMGSRMFGVKTSESYDQLWLFQKVSYLDGQGIVRVKLAADMLEYLFDLKQNYTTFQLQAALQLTSKYAKRIYTMCSQWKDKPETPRYSITEFKMMLGLVDQKTGKEEYKLFGDFKAKVLTLAITQINKHTDLHVELITEKTGRAVTKLGFKLAVKAYALPIPFSTDHLPEQVAVPGFTHQQLELAEVYLQDLRITDRRLVAQIMGSASMLTKLFRFKHDLATGKLKSTTNAGGLLLVQLGLRDAKTMPQQGRRPAKRTA